MAAHEDIQKSSSMPSTPQSFLYFETDSPFPQSTNEEIWPNSKRRRTQRTSSETTFIHMNGYKSDSQLGTRFNNTYVDSYSDSKAFDNSQNKSADAVSIEEDAAVVESAPPKADNNNEERPERAEPASTKSNRSSRKPVERSTETSSRVLKVKSGTGSSQQTNIQTFIFKTKLDPRLAYNRDRSDEPATPSSSNDNTEVKLEIPPAPPAAAAADSPAATVEPPAKSTRKTRKSEANILKFKSYTPNATPILRNTGRKSSQQFLDADSPITTQRSPTSTVDEFDPAYERVVEVVEQEKQTSPDKVNRFETPLKGKAATGANDGNSSQRRSTRIRKPANTILLGETQETPKRQKSHKETGSTPATQSKKPAGKSATIHISDTITHSRTNATPSPSVPDTGASRDDMMYERYGTASPEGLSANTRTSGRLRKPTIKAIEALQSKPRSRKRPRDSDQFVTLTEETPTNQTKPTPEPPNGVNAPSAVSMSRSDSGVGSEAMSLSFIVEDADFLGRQLYDLASTALVDATSSVDDDQAKIDEWREAFNQKKQKTQKNQGEAPTAANDEVAENEGVVLPSLIENLDDLPGEINEDVALEHPDKPRPWTEEDGWIHTGRVNEHGEEYCIAPASKYQWQKHTSNYRPPADGPIPNPPPFIKSVAEIRRDNIYGFPPSPGQRNLYQRHPGQVWKHENVEGLAGYLGSADSSGYGSGGQGGDAMDVDQPGRKTRYISRKGLPRFKRPLKLVLVDSTKTKTPEGGGSDKLSLRKRRQSAPATASKAATGSNRKRSFDMTGLGSAEGAHQAHQPRHQQRQQQRRKRQSTGKPETKTTTPARQKRQSTGATSQPVTPAAAAPKSTAKATPKGNSLGTTRMANSEKAISKNTAGESWGPPAAHEEKTTTMTPTTTVSGRARRRTLGAPKSNEIA